MEERILELLQALYERSVKNLEDPHEEPWPVLPRQLQDEVKRYE